MDKRELTEEEEKKQTPLEWDEENIKGDQATGEHILQHLDKSKGRSQKDTAEHHSRDFSQVDQEDLAEEDERQDELAREIEREHDLH